MAYARITILTVLAMIAFAGNSLLCRAALKQTSIDACSFTAIRVISGAVILWLLMHVRRDIPKVRGDWVSAFALFIYAAGFSLAYVSLPAATGALLLFCAVQATMISFAVWMGERLRRIQLVGFMLACGGLVCLLLPGFSAPPVSGSALMLVSGIAWGVYSLRGKGPGDPIGKTTGNFLRAVPIAAVFSALNLGNISLDNAGFWYAVTSGTLASGIGYAIWYTVLPALKSTNAATVQLSVPVIAALGGIVFLGEPITVRLLLASATILSGISLVILNGHQTSDGQPITSADRRT